MWLFKPFDKLRLETLRLGAMESQRSSLSLGQYVASLKTSKDQVKNREAFLERSQQKYRAPSIGGFPMVGLGGSCGKPAFQLPFVVRFDQDKVLGLEAVAEQFGMYVEYGAYPHLKLPDETEIAAVQDWANATLVFLRPSYERKEELLRAIAEALGG